MWPQGSKIVPPSKLLNTIFEKFPVAKRRNIKVLVTNIKPVRNKFQSFYGEYIFVYRNFP